MDSEKSINDILIKSANEGIKIQTAEGSMPAGMNGPWLNAQTPVRNTSHWALIFHYAHIFTKDSSYKGALQKCIDYLLSKKGRPSYFTFLCRPNNNSDDVNGLIGQAWVLEALIKIGDDTENKELIELAKEVYLLHPFDWHQGLWATVNTDGSLGRVIRTINQQIWWASIGCRILNIESHEIIKQNIDKFLHCLPMNLQINYNGMIRHLVLRKTWQNPIILKLLKPNFWKENQKLAEGYQTFNLIALANVYKHQNNHPIWHSKSFKFRIKKMLNFTLSNNYFEKAITNPYCFSYNINGVECKYALNCFQSLIKIQHEKFFQADRYLQFQIDNHVEKGIMDRNTLDRETLMARAYEFIYLQWKM